MQNTYCNSLLPHFSSRARYRAASIRVKDEGKRIDEKRNVLFSNILKNNFFHNTAKASIALVTQITLIASILITQVRQHRTYRNHVTETLKAGERHRTLHIDALFNQTSVERGGTVQDRSGQTGILRSSTTKAETNTQYGKSILALNRPKAKY